MDRERNGVDGTCITPEGTAPRNVPRARTMHTMR